MRISKKQFAKELKEYFVKKSGLTIPAAKKIIKEQIKKDEFDIEYKIDNVKLFYTSNHNFCQGIKNGYGAGWYLSNVSFKGGDYVKL